MLANMRYAPCRKCLVALKEMIRDRKSAMARAANMMVAGDRRLMQKVMIGWANAHRGTATDKERKLAAYFMGREQWWRMHVVDTCALGHTTARTGSACPLSASPLTAHVHVDVLKPNILAEY